MKEITGDLFKVYKDYDAVGITTNGIVKENGDLVMEVGVAKQVLNIIPKANTILGKKVLEKGNRVFSIGKLKDTCFISYPTKHHYKNDSNIDLIIQSAKQLVAYTNHFKWKKVILTRPGCGCGNLDWTSVKEQLNPILDDRFYIITPSSKSTVKSNDDGYTVCFTGPRPNKLHGYNDKSLYIPMKRELYKLCRFLIEKHNVTKFITGGAQGFDQIAYVVIEKLKEKYPHIQNNFYMPFVGQEKRWSKKGLFSQQEYLEQVDNADNVIIVNKEITDGNDFSLISKALTDRNKAMVNASDLVIGGYGDDFNDVKTIKRKKSGTLNCLRYAYAVQKPIINLNLHTFEITEDKINIKDTFNKIKK